MLLLSDCCVLLALIQALPCLPEKGNPAQEQIKELLQRAANLPKSPADLERASAAAEAVKLLYVKRSADDVRAGQPSPVGTALVQLTACSCHRHGSAATAAIRCAAGSKAHLAKYF